MCWLYPGKRIGIEAPCLDCNEPIRIEMRDGEFLRVEPETVVGHLNEKWMMGGSVEDRAFR